MTQPPIHPSQPPQGPYQPPANQTEAEKAGLFKAGKIALWVWIVLSIVPIVLILGCLGLCFGGAIVGSVLPNPTSTP